MEPVRIYECHQPSCPFFGHRWFVPGQEYNPPKPNIKYWPQPVCSGCNEDLFLIQK